MTLREFNNKYWTFGELYDFSNEMNLSVMDGVMTKRDFDSWVEENLREWNTYLGWEEILSRLSSYAEYGGGFDFYDVNEYGDAVGAYDYGEDYTGDYIDMVRDAMFEYNLFDDDGEEEDEGEDTCELSEEEEDIQVHDDHDSGVDEDSMMRIMEFVNAAVVAGGNANTNNSNKIMDLYG